MIVARLAATTVLITTLLLTSVPSARAGFVTLKGDPPDYTYLSDKVCCVDVAAGNMLAQLARDKQAVKDTLKAPKTEQEDFHRRYDPDFKHPDSASAADAKTGWDKTLADKGLKGDVKVFGTRLLSYETLVSEWKDDELIMLLMSGTGGIGHAVFLWGLDDDPKAAKPELGIVDPNVHPNTEQPVDGKATTAKGTSTRVGLTIGQDAAGLPDWRITIPAGKYIYPEVPDVEFSWAEKSYRITGFVSVSDVSKIPLPASAALLLPGLVLLVGLRNARR